MRPDNVRVVACPRPFSIDRIDRLAPDNRKITDHLRDLGLDPDRVHARVFVDDVLIPSAFWEKTRPKAGHVLTVRVVPTGGEGGKNILRLVAVLGIVAAAFFTPVLLGLEGLAAASLSVGIGIVGNLGVNGPIPQPLPRRLT